MDQPSWPSCSDCLVHGSSIMQSNTAQSMPVILSGFLLVQQSVAKFTALIICSMSDVRSSAPRDCIHRIGGW